VENGRDGSLEKKEITIIHFNDVYDIFPSSDEPVGGAARFARLVKDQQNDNPLILFSGDCLNPSTLSAFTKGEHMVPIMNEIGVHVAALGNHGAYASCGLGNPHALRLVPVDGRLVPAVVQISILASRNWRKGWLNSNFLGF